MSAEVPVKLTEDQIAKCQEAFDKFDRRALDKIRIGDIANAFKAMSVSVKPEWLDRVRDSIDQEGTGYVTMEEFTELYLLKLKAEADEKELEEAFRVLDKNNTGVIPVDDLRFILKGLGDDLTDEEIEEMINDTDQDGSGTVDFDEFSHLMLSA
ncbi:unnamed protein product [Owenia fusiformis]|uniref:Uncharacterized protein n=1 Tax=Owenia fusiformis TaxID=6347 RepID=A0A8J1UPW9_OWEFU|nr:unnamed protein product [Owenia fusiformis]